MPAAYAHLTLVNVLKELRRLESIPGMPRPAVIAVGRYAKICELGAVSPDYPYLALGDADAAKCADAMHYTRIGDMIRVGADYVRALSGDVQQKCVAWLLGYCAHLDRLDEDIAGTAAARHSIGSRAVAALRRLQRAGAAPGRLRCAARVHRGPAPGFARRCDLHGAAGPARLAGGRCGVRVQFAR